MVSAAGSQMVRDVVAGTGTTVREISGWLSFGLLPVIAYLCDRPRWRTWTVAWGLIAAGWWFAGRPGREIWTSDARGAMWISLALATHAAAFGLRWVIYHSGARRRPGLLRLLLVGWTAAILLHPSVVLYRVSRDWYDCPCQKQQLK